MKDKQVANNLKAFTDRQKLPRYLQQYHRMLRWYRRCETIMKKGLSVKALEDLEDQYNTFFVNCFHLKDWIIQDPDCPHRLQVEQYVAKNEYLSLCRDLCHSVKHLVLTKGGTTTHLKDAEVLVWFERKKMHSALVYQVPLKNGPMHAFEFATHCVKAWQSFLKIN